jgi:hypothetical protein
MSRQDEFAEFLNIGGNLAFQTLKKPTEPSAIQPQMITSTEKKISVLHPDDPISEKQINTIEGILERFEHADTTLLEAWRESMTKGEASEFISKYYKKK